MRLWSGVSATHHTGLARLTGRQAPVITCQSIDGNVSIHTFGCPWQYSHVATHRCLLCGCSTDLLALPTCDPDKSFAVQISHEETMVQGPVAFVQCALLHTSSNGERRIRWAQQGAQTGHGTCDFCTPTIRIRHHSAMGAMCRH